MSANYDFGQRCGGHQPSSKSASVGNVLSAMTPRGGPRGEAEPAAIRQSTRLTSPVAEFGREADYLWKGEIDVIRLRWTRNVRQPRDRGLLAKHHFCPRTVSGEAFVGIDAGKLWNAVAIADAGRDGEIRYFGEIDASAESIRRLIVPTTAQR
jgi:hypothetical protein